MNVGQTDDNPIFPGIKTIKFNADNFYVTQQDTDTSIVNFRGVPKLTVAQTDGKAIFGGIERINFNNINFYLTQNTTSLDEVQVNWRDIDKAVTKSFVIESPTATEDVSLFFTYSNITINKIRAVLKGSGSPLVKVDFRHDKDRSGTPGLGHGSQIGGFYFDVTSTTTGQNVTLGGDVTVPANSWIWLETIQKDDTVNELNFTFSYTDNDPNVTKAWTVESPSECEDITLFFTDRDIEIQNVRAVLRGNGSPLVKVDLRHDPDRTALGSQIGGFYFDVTSTTIGDALNLTGDVTVPADSWIWLETIQKDDTVNDIAFTMNYTELK